MGFGLLFIGYILTYLLSMAGAYGCYPAIIGCALMLYALTHLVEYEASFKLPFFSALPMTLCVTYSFVVELFSSLGILLPVFLTSSVTLTVVTYASALFDLVFNMTLLYAITCIAKETGVDRIRNAAIRNIVVYGVYFLSVLLDESLPRESAVRPYTFLAAFFLSLLVLVLNSIVIFSCYMRICDESDTEMERKESRFEVINKFNKEFDRREQKVHRESRERREARIKNRASGKKHKK